MELLKGCECEFYLGEGIIRSIELHTLHKQNAKN